MSTVKDQLHALAEQIAGALVFIDVVYTIRTAGSNDETTGTTAEAALARFIAERLEADAEDGTGPTAEPAPLLSAPVMPPPAQPTNGNGNGAHKTTKHRNNANRDRVRAFMAQNLAPIAIAEQTGLTLANVYYHQGAIRKEQEEPPAAPAPFRN